MATKLDELSVAIGALQEGQRRAEVSRVEHARKTEEKFDLIEQKLDLLVQTIDGKIETKVEKASTRFFHGSIGGGLIVALQVLADHLGLKLPWGS